jgi:ribosomal protein S18 acetylase RimI-like enzyme
MPSTPSFVVRAAGVADAAAIASVHVAAWRETYAGLLPDAMLARLSVPLRSAMWERTLRNPADADETVAIVAERGGEVVGFSSCGRQRTADLRAAGYDGEFSALYVLSSAQRLGIGTALMRATAAHLSAGGYSGGALWVLRDNANACRFYERLGGVGVGERTDTRGLLTLPERAFGWPKLTSLLDRPTPGGW